MFGIGPFEFFVIAAIALVVIGPEKFPEFARVVMRSVNDFRTYVNEAKRDIEREIRPVQQEFNRMSKVDAKEYLNKLTEEPKEEAKKSETDYSDATDDPESYESAEYDPSADDAAQDSNTSPEGAEPFDDGSKSHEIHGGYNVEPNDADWLDSLNDGPEKDDVGEMADLDESTADSESEESSASDDEKKNTSTYPPEPFDG